MAKRIKTSIVILLSYFLIFGQSIALAQSTASILPQGKTQFLDNNGNPLSSGKVYFYIPSTTTFKTTWQDAAETTPNTNPVTLDAGGRAIIYGSGTYRQLVKASNGNTIYDVVTASAGSGGGTTGTGDGDLVGTVKPWAGLVAPNQYAFAYGQEISRTTYSVLYTAITLNQSITCTSGSPIAGGFSDTSQIPATAVIESVCFAPGTSVLSKTATTVTFNNNASLTTIDLTARIFLYGNGNGSTTFNLPDLRGNLIAGRPNMGGIASSNLTSLFFGTNPQATGAKGGSQGHTLDQTQLPSVTPSGTISLVTGTNSKPSITTTGNLNVLQNIAGATWQSGANGGIGVTNIQASLDNAPVFTGNAQTFTGTPFGGGAPFSILNPIMTLNYIIKIIPDSNSADASGVTSIQGMTGDISCGAGVLCTGNTITASPNASPWIVSGNNIYNSNSANVGINNVTPASKLDIISNGGIIQLGVPAANSLMIADGSAATPISTQHASLFVSKYENCTLGVCGDGSISPSILGVNIQDAAATAQNVAVAGVTWGQGNTDTAAGYFSADKRSGTGGAFGIFGNATVRLNTGSALASNLNVSNLTSSNYAYSSNLFGLPIVTSIDLSYGSTGAFNGTVGLLIRGDRSSTGKWNVGIGFNNFGGVSPTSVADIQTDSSATSILLANSGAHTNGINLTGASSTYSGNAFMSPGYSVDGAGVTTIKSLSAVTAASVNLQINRISNATTYNVVSVNNIITSAGYIGIAGGAAGDTVLYLQGGASGIQLKSAGTTIATLAGGVAVGLATDPGAGVVSALTGFRINNAATTGNVLRGDGTNFVNATLAASDLSNGVIGSGNVVLATTPTGFIKVAKEQKFITTGTYTPSTGIVYAIAECWGPAGGGGGATSAVGNSGSGGGGGAGGYSRVTLSAATIGVSKAVVIGTGGAGGANTGATGANGSAATTVGSTLCVANAGNGGVGNTGNAGVLGGTGGTSGTGDETFIGAAGGAAIGYGINTIFAPVSGNGGGSGLGGAGTGGFGGAANCTAGKTNTGSGGGGASSFNGTGGNIGCAGADGFVRITEFTNQ